MASILFVNPPQRKVYEKYTYSRYQFPLGLAYVMAPLMETDHNASVYDANNSSELSIEWHLSRICESYHDYVAFTCTTPLFSTVVSLAEGVKRNSPKTKVLVGGQHITALYRKITNTCFDYLFVGEHDTTMVDFLNDPPKNRIVFGKTEDSIDALPIPPRHLFYDKNNIDTRLGDSFTYMITSRGCVGRCKYCVAGTKSPRFRSVENIGKELDSIVGDIGIKKISFEDDNFLVSKKRTFSLCEEISRWNIEYFAMAIAKLVDNDILDALKDSGCKWLCYGVESGNDSILKDMGRLSMTEEVRKAVEITKSKGIKVRATYMLGWVGETEAQMEDTIRFMKELDADENAVSIVTPYPGTQLWDKLGMENKTVDFDNFCYYNKIAFNLSSVPDSRLLELQQEAFSARGNLG